MLHFTDISRAQKYWVWYLCDDTCVVSSFSFFPTWAPSITKQKDYVQNGLGNYYILRGSFIYLRNEILSHYHLLIITLNLFRLLLLVFLLGGSYQECWNASCQVCRFLLSKTDSPGIKKVNLAGVAPFRDPTVPLSSSCLHSELLPWFCLLLILHHGSMLFTELSKKQFETYARKEAFHYMK